MFESEFESNLFALRQDKLRQIAALGQQTYPNQFVATHTLSEVRQQFGEIPAEVLDAQRTMVTVAGRIMAIRAQGKAGFAQLQQGGERLQIYVRLDAVGEQGFQLYKLLDLGDHIGVTGYRLPHSHWRAHRACRNHHLPGQGHAGIAGEISWAGRRRTSLPAALRRSVHEHRCARGVHQTGKGAQGNSIVLRSARIHRSRDAHDAAGRWGRCCQAFAPTIMRWICTSICGSRRSSISSACRRRPGQGLRDKSQLPQ